MVPLPETEAFDVVILGSDKGHEPAVVECKRYAHTNKVGVHLVRYIVRAAIQWQVKKAYLVTSSSFTQGARRQAIDFRGLGYDIELIAMADLVELLGVYNESLPRSKRIVGGTAGKAARRSTRSRVICPTDDIDRPVGSAVFGVVREATI